MVTHLVNGGQFYISRGGGGGGSNPQLDKGSDRGVLAF